MSTRGGEMGAAARRLRRAPGFTAAAVATLALGLGVNLAIFSGLYAALWQPLPYPEPGRLVHIAATTGAYNDVSIFPPLAHAVAAPDSRTMTAVGLYADRELVLTGLGPAEQMDTMLATPELFTALSVAPERGRALTAADAATGATPVMLVSDAFWRERLHSAPLAGLALTLDGVPHEVIGVLAPGFPHFNHDFGDLVVPLNARNEFTVGIWAVGRLRAGMGVPAAQAEAAQRVAQAPLAGKGPRPGIALAVLPGWLHGQYGGVPWYLLGAAGLILLLACVNTASLLLARIGGRRREFAIRQALGASRGRLLAQVMSEVLLLALGGGVAAWALAWGLLRGLAVMHPPHWLASTGFESPVRIAFAIVASLLAGLVCSLTPAWQAARRPRAVQEMAPRRLRGGVIAIETGLALMLAIAAALLIRTVAQLDGVPLGFDGAGVLTADFVMPPAKYKAAAAREAFYAQLLPRVVALPSVERAAVAYPLPMTGQALAAVRVAGSRRVVAFAPVSPGFFETLGIRLLAGRGFRADDRAGSPGVAVVTRGLADAWWPGANPIGKQFTMTRTDNEQPVSFRVVGVAADIHQLSHGAAAEPEAFLPASQFPLPDPLSLAVRTSGDAAALAQPVKQAAMAIDPAVVVKTSVMADLVSSDVRSQKFYLELLTLAAGLALLLAAVGVYGTVSYWVGERRQEMGVRLALGARPAQVERHVLARTLRWALVGAVLGAGGAIAAGRALSSLLFEVKPGDPLSLAAGTALLLVVAAAAAWWPARRAASVDPAAALRQE